MKRAAYLFGLTGSVFNLLLLFSFLLPLFVIPGMGNDPEGFFHFCYYCVASLCAFCMARKVRDKTSVAHCIAMLLLGCFLMLLPLMLLSAARQTEFDVKGEAAVMGVCGTAAILLYITGGILALFTRNRPYPCGNHDSSRIGKTLGYAAGGANAVMGIFVCMEAAESFSQFVNPGMSFFHINDPFKLIFLFLFLLLLLLTPAGALVGQWDRAAGGVLQIAAGTVLAMFLLISTVFRSLSFWIDQVVATQNEFAPAGYIKLPLAAALFVCQLAVILSGILSLRFDKKRL